MPKLLLCPLILCIAALAASAQERPGTPGVVTSGSQNTTIGGHAAARQGDTTSDSNTIVEGSKNVFINGKPAASSAIKRAAAASPLGVAAASSSMASRPPAPAIPRRTALPSEHLCRLLSLA
jgi:uncharacterized Zn-binding protein involved in type VI secretion